MGPVELGSSKGQGNTAQLDRHNRVKAEMRWLVAAA